MRALTRLLGALWTRVIADPRLKADEEAAAWWAQPAADRRDSRTVWVLVVAAISLTLLEYLGMSNRYGRSVVLLDWLGLDTLACWLDASIDGWSVPTICSERAEYIERYGLERTLNTSREIARLAYWASWCLIGYLLLPALVVKLVFREKLVDYGFRVKGAFSDVWIYGVFLAAVLPLVVIVSGDSHFQNMYPFYDLREHEPLWPNFWMWEVMYFSQFLALEFFFRGFLIHGVRHRFGYASVLVAMVPYCMIHFGKPMPETFGAILAGIALASLSLKTRSIWMGVAIHTTVALSMDFASLWRQGYFG